MNTAIWQSQREHPQKHLNEIVPSKIFSLLQVQRHPLYIILILKYNIYLNILM